MYVAHLYPFISVDTQVFPYLGYCEQYCFEHRCACIYFLNYSSVQKYAQEQDHRIIRYLQFFEELPYRFPQWLYQFTFPPAVQQGSLFFTFFPAFSICRLFNDGYSDWREVVLILILICISLIIILLFFDIRQVLLKFKLYR